jgi:hypothetical protein
MGRDVHDVLETCIGQYAMQCTSRYQHVKIHEHKQSSYHRRLSLDTEHFSSEIRACYGS